MAGLTSIIPTVVGAALGPAVGAATGIPALGTALAGVGTELSRGLVSREQQARTLSALRRQQQAEEAAAAQRASDTTARAAQSLAADERRRQAQLRQQQGALRADFARRGLLATGGSADALLAGLQSEADAERAEAAEAERLRRVAVGNDLDALRRRNLLEASALADRQRLDLLSRLI